MKGEKGFYWQNWSESVYCEPTDYVEPNNLTELQAVVRQAYDNDQNIRILGAGHSFTPLVATTDTIVTIHHLRGIDHIDHEKHFATVWGGSTLKELGEQLWEHGYAMENLGDINKQSIAGAVSTGTHGTGMNFGSISTQVVGVTLLLANGELLEINEDHSPELLPAVQLSLGMLGIIVKVTLKVLPAYELEGHSYRLSLDKSLRQIDHLRKQHRHMELYWFPYTNTVQIKTMNLAKRRRNKKQSKGNNSFKKLVLENGVFWGMSEVSRLLPKASGIISTISAAGVPVGSEVRPSHELFITPRLVKFQEMEYAVPVEKFVHIMREMDATIRDEKFAVHFPIECRFVHRDNIWLSPSYERDCAYIAVHMYKGMEFSPYFQALETIFRRHGGRPHWAKMHTMNSKALQQAYPQLDNFVALRNKLDEHGIFLNEYTKELFGLKKDGE